MDIFVATTDVYSSVKCTTPAYNTDKVRIDRGRPGTDSPDIVLDRYMCP